MVNYPSISVSIHTATNNSIHFKYYNIITNKCDIWHYHLGYPSNDIIIHINKKFPLHFTTKPASSYDTCFMAKQKWFPFYNSVTKSFNYFDIVHMDIWGPIPTPSMLGHKYFLTIADDYNRFYWIFLMKLPL